MQSHRRCGKALNSVFLISFLDCASLMDWLSCKRSSSSESWGNKSQMVESGQAFAAYSEAVEFRSTGASHAAEFGAVASVIRSVASPLTTAPEQQLRLINGVYGGGQDPAPGQPVKVVQ